MQSVPDLKGAKLHFAASISWHHKSPLQFYNDEHDPPPVVTKKPPKPRKSKYQSNDQYQQCLIDWETYLPHDLEVQPKGNLMTQAYYTERLLPVYAKEINDACVFASRRGILQEDNDNSHETRSNDNVVKNFKDANWIETLIHPPQSPNLNPSKAGWDILKQRARYCQWRTIAQLKEMLLEEWDKISIDQIWAQISEMPDQCKKVIASGDKAIKSSH